MVLQKGEVTLGVKMPIVQELVPGEHDQERVATLKQIEILSETSKNPRFVSECRAFIAAAESGDEVVEFCTSKQSWRKCLGMQGYLLRRNSEIVARLITTMN